MSSNTALSISPDFTIEDIHKIREWNYERRKGMSAEEIIADTAIGADSFAALIAKQHPSNRHNQGSRP
jgi:hypothetical protein